MLSYHIISFQFQIYRDYHKSKITIFTEFDSTFSHPSDYVLPFQDDGVMSNSTFALYSIGQHTQARL